MSPRERLRLYMEERDLNQSQAGELLGCSQTLVSKILQGARTPNLALAFRIQDLTSKTGRPIGAREWVIEPDELDATGS